MSKLLDGVTLTEDFANNREEKDMKNLKDFNIFVDYAENDSVGQLELLLEYSSIDDSEGSEEWHSHSQIADDGTVTQKIFKFASPGAYRIPIKSLPREDKIRVSVRETGTPATFGTATVGVIDDRIQVS